MQQLLCYCALQRRQKAFGLKVQRRFAMSNVQFEQFNKQFESTVIGPARAFNALAIDHVEKLINTQFEATRAYTEAGLGHLRSVIDVKDPEGLRSYVETQQKAARDLGERIKGDAEKVAALNQEFVQKAQQIAEKNVKTVSKAAGQAAK